MQLVVGRVGRPHGIRGELTVQVHTDDPDLRFAAGSVLATEPAARGPLTVSASRWHSGRLLVTFAGYADRSQAEELRGTLLVMDSSEVGPAADPEEFHDYELIGLEVLTRAGEPVGVVADVLHQGQDLLVIQPQEGRPAGEHGEVLVPFVAAIVPEVDVTAGRLVIDPPPGLLDLGAAG
jgi:16S rRNA processing protein RimM